MPHFQCDVRGLEQPPADHGVWPSLPPSASARLLSPSSSLTDAQRRELTWRPVAFPHRDFVRLMPQRGVFGWYACRFDVPPELEGLDVTADLGIIDDTDATFINGQLLGGVGEIGQPHGTAWCQDRRYRIPQCRLRPTDNYLAIHVWSLWGLGGMVGPPVLSASVAPDDAQWELAFVPDDSVPRSGLNRALTAQAALAAVSGGEELSWTNVPLPWTGFADWPETSHVAVFRLSFEMMRDGSPRRLPAEVVMDVGPVFDVAAFYLNGRRLALVGRFPEGDEPAFTEAAQRAQFLIRAQDWAPDGRNELLAVVYRERGIGGLPGVPGLLLEPPSQHEEGQPFAVHTAHFQLLLQSGRRCEAARLLRRIRPASDSERAWLLSHHAHLAYLKWLDRRKPLERTDLIDGVLAPMAELLSALPVEAPRQSAMQALCRLLRLAEENDQIMQLVRRRFPGALPDVPTFRPDRLTQGDWACTYGADTWVLGAMAQVHDLQNGSSPPFGYRLSIPGRRDRPRMWLPQRQFNLSDRYALSFPDGNEFARSLSAIVRLPSICPLTDGLPLERGRAASWWDDHGEMHPFDDEGPDLFLELPDIDLIAGYLPPKVLGGRPSMRPPHLAVTLHHQDYDWRRTLHPRQQSIIMSGLDGTLLDAVWLGKTDTGVYQTFHVRRDRPVRFRSIKHRSACVALSGFFTDYHALLPQRGRGLPWRHWHPAAHIPDLPPPLRSAATDLLDAAPGPSRLAAARAFLALADQTPMSEAPMPQALFLAIATDAAFDFHARHPQFLRQLDSMQPSDMKSLLRRLAYARCHLRWLFIVGVRLLETCQRLPPEQAQPLLKTLTELRPDIRLSPISNAARELLRSQNPMPSR